MTDREKVISILKSLNFPQGQYAVSGSSIMYLHNIPREKSLGDVDIFVSTALWFDLYESTKGGLIWGVALPESDDMKRRCDPPYLFAELLEVPINVYFSWRKRGVGDIDPAFWLNNTEMVEEFPCVPVQLFCDWKESVGRAKDLDDIRSMKEWLVSR